MNSLHIDTDGHTPESKFYGVNSLSAKFVLAGEKLVATYSIST